MRIRWQGHACFEISNQKTIVTDPHDGKSIGIAPPVVRADIVLVSHDHFDHNCTRIVKGEAKIVKNLGKSHVDGTTIFGISSYHDDVQGEKRGENTVFKFFLDDISFCHLGDLGHVLDRGKLDEIGEIDILFIPVGGVFTIDGKDAWNVCESIKPKVVIPMHYRVGGLSLSIQPLEPFLRRVKNVEVNRVGNEIEFGREDLPEKMEIWAFTL